MLVPMYLYMNIPVLPLADVWLIIHGHIYCFHNEHLLTTTNPHSPTCTPSISPFVTSSMEKQEAGTSVIWLTLYMKSENTSKLLKLAKCSYYYDLKTAKTAKRVLSCTQIMKTWEWGRATKDCMETLIHNWLNVSVIIWAKLKKLQTKNKF